MKLTEHQERVVALTALGLGNKAIARKLGITESCVKQHLHKVMGRLAISNRTELALWMAARVGEHDHDKFDR